MSIKHISIFCLLFVIFSCDNNVAKNHTDLNDTQKKSLAKQYHQISNTFLQPSELYRKYKDSALQIEPNNVIYRQKLSYSYKKVGDHIKAMEVLNNAVDIDIANGKSDVLQYRAWTLLYYYRDYEGVIEDVALIENITGNTYNTCWGEVCGFLKGQALYKLGDFKKSIEAFNTVNDEEKKLGFNTNDNYMIFFYLGRCYTELNDFNKAIEYYEKALVTVDRFPEAYYNLGLVYKKMNNEKLANKNFDLAKQNIAFSINEPYVERFDEVFMYMIDREIITK